MPGNGHVLSANKKRRAFMIKNRILMFLAFTSFCCGNVAHATLLISEYVEGSSYNKALELYNDGSAIDFDAGLYSIAIYTNGSNSPSRTLALTGSIAQGSAYVLANSRADAGLLGLADLASGSLNFNGDDAVVLLQDGAIIDRIGQIGFDPGIAWGSGSVTTANATLRRAPDILAGDSLAYDAFDPAAQWLGYATDDFSGLGQHVINSALSATTPSATTTSSKSAAVPVPSTLYLALLGLVIVWMMSGRAVRMWRTGYSVTRQLQIA
jgi:predicted extracellular nuclease